MAKLDKRAVPPQHTGVKSNKEHAVTCASVDEAKLLFEKAKQRLLNVSAWQRVSNGPSAHFQLTNTYGNPVNRPAEVGDKFRIDIPAPGTQTGDGFDWVEVEEIKETGAPTSDSESLAMRVRPCSNPLSPEDDTAHFFTDEATSSFVVIRNDDTVRAEVHGRNEKPNTADASTFLDKARNAVVAVGAMAGLNKPQWNALVKGLLEEEND